MTVSSAHCIEEHEADAREPVGDASDVEELVVDRGQTQLLAQRVSGSQPNDHLVAGCLGARGFERKKSMATTVACAAV